MEEKEIRLEARDLNQQGMMLLRAGQIEEARAKFDKAIELDPMLMDSYKNYGDLYMATDEYQNAKNSYKKAMLVEKQPLLHFLYGNACFMNDEPHEGLENYNMAITGGYDGEEMMYFMGMAYENLNDDKMALRFYQRACNKNPSRPDYMIKKVSVQLRLGLYDGAEETAQDLLRKAPEMYEGYHIMNLMYLYRKEYEKGVTFAKDATERFPEDVDLMRDYAKSLALSDRLDESLAVIDRAKKMKYFAQAKRDFLLLQAEIRADRGQFEEAIADCDECLSVEAERGFDGEVHFMRMNMYLGKQNFQKALEDAEAIIAANEANEYYYAALYYRPFCCKNLGRQEEAVHLYKEASTLYRLATLENPAAVDVYLYRAMCLKDLEEYDKALEMLEFVENLSGEVAEIYTIRASIYREQGKSALAEEELRKAYKLKPELEIKDESMEA